ncbi:amino acid ABC transporter substrate-binding protein [Pseudomonas lalucatii]|uniref:Amino acid ABC transporter substrate-binding protein n=1 Tax=Pseudomonas lalucatii TaxID=1424203 RepID=A0ABS5Q6I2_9PSED|nr:transporter substrate-binding domain-containing protein [Pseudomonas lalucatii]MBS7664341.1 amino acid ABC transporter substrate-binding protein [Pseudomonas lalucatii]MBS7690991.1 amino acid ABC transporter substrate-binding protein [Pseudomonas lalucatii]QVM86498.1 amino acid ABC transporter substrate-binding protein [Pseudomonas lalucatii]
MNGLRAWCLSLAVLCWPAAATEVLRLVASPWPPFNDLNLPGNGLASELVSSALARAGYATHYAEMPWARAVKGLRQAQYDVLINAWHSEERSRFGYFSRPYLVNRIRLLRRRDATVPFARLADLYPYRIAVMRDYAYSAAFDADARLTRIRVGSFQSGARMLAAGRVDLMPEDEFVARYHLGRGLRDVRDRLEFVAQPLSENGLHILVSLGRPDHRRIAEAFDRAIAAMRADGSYAAILRRHGF